MSKQQFIQNIRNLIAKDDLSTALIQLKALLDKTPLLNEVLHQSGRFEDIRNQIRLGTVSHAEANLTQNQIRAALIELLAEIDQQGEMPMLRKEMEDAASVVNSKNVLVNSHITAGGDIHVGDKTIYTESKTSSRLRLFLYLFVPLLALGIAYLWYRAQPLTLTVTLQYQAANPDLAFTEGSVTLYHGSKPEVKTITNEAIFTGIQHGEQVNLHFAADGFEPIDTLLEPNQTLLRLPIRHDNSLSRISGTVRDEHGKTIGGVLIRVQDLTTRTLPDGSYSLAIPPDQQRKKQRVEAIINGKVVWNYTQPVMANGPIDIRL